MDNKENKSCIERIEIKGLWGRFDVDWTLHHDVNILVGENGRGKSTILKLVSEILGQEKDIYPHNMDSTKAYHYNLTDFSDFAVLIKLSGFNYLRYPVISVVHDNDYYSVKNFSSETNINIRDLKYSYFDVLEEDTTFKINESDKVTLNEKLKLNFQLLQTFENQLLEEDTIQKIGNNEIKTSLDFILYNLEKSYWKYQIELFERIVNLGLDKNEVNKMHQLFFKKINEFFQPTGKTIGQRKTDKAIVFNQNGTELSLYQLSSGEKQLLTILLTVLFQDEKPFILLLDEPEISLHLRWQYKLIDTIRALNPNCQVIIATHSPSLFSDGWNDRVFWIEDICKPILTLEKHDS